MSESGFDLSAIPADALSDAISKISEHPEIISTVASALNLGEGAATEKPPQAEGLGSIMTMLGPLLSGGAKKSPRDNQRDALLCALKPYLSEERRHLIDNILKFGQLGNILKLIK